jgi:transcriptional regulator with XRE-family HTH domain
MTKSSPIPRPAPDAKAKRRIGGLIRRRRLATGMTQATLGKCVGVSYQQVQKYEYGTSWPSEERLAAIAKIFGVTSDYFLSDEQTASADDVEALERFLQRPGALLLFNAISRLPDQKTFDRLILANLAFCEKHAQLDVFGPQGAAWFGGISNQSEVKHAEKVIRELKIEIARLIAKNISGRKFTQIFSAKVLRTDQARISKLSRGDVSGISFERLFRFLVMLGCNATIKIEARAPSEKGGIDLIHRKETSAQKTTCHA